MIHVSKRYGLLLAIEAPSQSSVIRPLPVAFWGCTASFWSSSATCICVSEFLCPDVSSYHLTGDIDNWVDTDRGAEGWARVVFCIKMCEPCSANGIPRMKVAALTLGIWLHCDNVWPYRLISRDFRIYISVIWDYVRNPSPKPTFITTQLRSSVWSPQSRSAIIPSPYADLGCFWSRT